MASDPAGPPCCIGILGCASHNDPAARRALDFALTRAIDASRGDFLFCVPAESGPSWFAAQYARSHGLCCLPAASPIDVRTNADVVIACRCIRAGRVVC